MDETKEDSAKAQIVRSNKSDAVEHIKWILDFLKGIAWPLLVAIVLLVYHSEIRQIITLIPKELLSANKVTIGSLSYEISQQARSHGGPALQASVGRLSRGAVTLLIETGDHPDVLPMKVENGIGLPRKEELDSLEELEKAGLIAFAEPLQDYLQFVNGLNWTSKIPNNDRILYLFGKPIPDELANRLESEDYHLTNQGIKAFNAIVTAITNQLSDTGESG